MSLSDYVKQMSLELKDFGLVPLKHSSTYHTQKGMAIETMDFFGIDPGELYNRGGFEYVKRFEATRKQHPNLSPEDLDKLMRMHAMMEEANG